MSRKALPGQIPFPFVAELDKQLAAEREREREYSRCRNAESHIESCLEAYPPSSAEWDIMTMGIRLCRFVNDHLECSKCGLDTRDHTVGFMFWYWSAKNEQDIPIKICLKDYYRKCKELGIKPYIPPHDR